jgi:hypothetical protein
VVRVQFSFIELLQLIVTQTPKEFDSFMESELVLKYLLKPLIRSYPKSVEFVPCPQYTCLYNVIIHSNNIVMCIPIARQRLGKHIPLASQLA